MAAASTNQAGRPQGQADDRGQTVNRIDNDKSKATALAMQTRHLPWAHSAERCRKKYIKHTFDITQTLYCD